MTPTRFKSLCQRIADTVNHDLNIRGALVDAQQVACVAAGTDRTESHPTIQAVMVELRRHGIAIAAPMAIDSGFD